MTNTRMIRAELARRELARRHYRDYLRYVHGAAWIETAMSRFLADRVQAFLEADTGHAFDVLLIETPPQHGKSMTVTEALPSWQLGTHPDARIILAAYNDELAERFLRRNREKLQRFGDTLFGVSVGGLNRASAIELAGHRGGMIARGIRSGITGNPADLILVDDPVKSREEADSDVWRAKVWEEWQNSLKSRLAAGAKVIVIMTPWHEDDLAGRLLRSERNVTLLRLPVAAEAGDPLGRRPGAALCPELGKGDRWLRDFRRSYVSDPKGGARAWAALYQCSPRVEDGNLVRRGWWRYYDPAAVREFSAEVISVDAAFKGTEKSDFVAITVWGKRGNDYYLRHVVNRQMGFLRLSAPSAKPPRAFPPPAACSSRTRPTAPPSSRCCAGSCSVSRSTPRAARSPASTPSRPPSSPAMCSSRSACRGWRPSSISGRPFPPPRMTTWSTAPPRRSAFC